MEVIRKLELDDLEQIVSLIVGIQDYDFQGINLNSRILNQKELEKETIRYLEKSLNNNLVLFGYFIDEKLIANCGFYIDRHFPTYKNPTGMIGYICNVFTLEEYREKGYQKKLFKKCIECCKKMGITNFKLSSKNEKAIKMYKSFGFVEDKNQYRYKVSYDDKRIF